MKRQHPKHEEYTIQKWTSDYWQAFKDIRIEALRLEPAVFSSNHAREAAFTDQEWQRRLDNPKAAFFGLYHNNIPIGLTGIIELDAEQASAALIASYIRRQYRGQGLSALLYEARIALAREQGYRAIIVSHRAGNESSCRANQRFGFTFTHKEVMQWPDGKEADNVFYKLELQP